MKNKKAQFQGSKANARKQAFLARVEKRRQNRMLPVMMPKNRLSVPVLNALINPIMSDVVYEDEKSYLLLGV